MNDFSELEADLKKLRPVAASRDLILRIEQALALPEAGPTAGVLPHQPTSANRWWSFLLGLTGVAALFIIGLTYFDHSANQPQRTASAGARTPAPASTSGFRPAGLSQVVYRGRDEGLIFLPNESPRRRLRYETRQTMRWRNPQTGASVRVSYPVEQVVLTPVSFE